MVSLQLFLGGSELKSLVSDNQDRNTLAMSLPFLLTLLDILTEFSLELLMQIYCKYFYDISDVRRIEYSTFAYGASDGEFVFVMEIQNITHPYITDLR